MLKKFLVIFSLVAAAYGAGQLTILECPDEIKLPKSSKLDGRQIGQVFRAFMGYSITEPVPFKVELPPFDLAESVCLIDIDGIKDFTSKTLKPKSEINIFGPDNSIETFTNKLYTDSEPMVTVNLNDGLEALSPIQDWCETPSKPDNAEIQKALKEEKATESKQFVEAIAVMSILSEANCKMPAFSHIELKLNDVKSRDKYFELFANTVGAFAEKQHQLSNGRGIVAVLTTDKKPLKRSRRAAPADDAAVAADAAAAAAAARLAEYKLRKELNLADAYDEDYPVIFNIILWFGVAMVFTMLAISYTIGYMDPGRDSIIYRMTSTRIKKDN